MSRKKNNIKKDNIEFMEATEYNLLTLNDYYNRLKRIALSMFEWINLPTSMNERFLEFCLFEYGFCGVFYSEKYGLVNSLVSQNEQVNQYMLPSKLNLYSVGNIWNEKRNLFISKNSNSLKKEAIYVMNNFECSPTKTSINLFAHRLAKAERTIDINLNSMKTPLILTCENEGQVQTLKNLLFQYDGNIPAIIGNSKLINADTIKVFKTDTPVYLEDLNNYKKSIWNEALTFFGVNNLSEEKRERLVIDEANSNNELINLNLQSYLIQRKLACKQINEYMDFPKDKEIDVRVRSDLKNIIKENMSIVSDFINNESGDDNE